MEFVSHMWSIKTEWWTDEIQLAEILFISLLVATALQHNMDTEGILLKEGFNFSGLLFSCSNDHSIKKGFNSLGKSNKVDIFQVFLV